MTGSSGTHKCYLKKIIQQLTNKLCEDQEQNFLRLTLNLTVDLVKVMNFVSLGASSAVLFYFDCFYCVLNNSIAFVTSFINLVRHKFFIKFFSFIILFNFLEVALSIRKKNKCIKSIIYAKFRTKT
jgi:hypothetical protein